MAYADLVKRRATKKAWCDRNKEKVRAYNKIFTAKYPERRTEHLKKQQQKDPFQLKFVKTRKGAKERGKEFSITKEDLVALWNKQNGLCYYTGKPMTMPFYGTKDRNVISVDRIDSSRGYVQDNVVLCRTIVNLMKLDQSDDDFSNVIKELYEHHVSR